MDKIKEITEKYSVQTPAELIRQADKNESSLITDDLFKIIAKMDLNDRYEYLKALLDIFKDEKIIRAMTPLSTAEAIEIKESKEARNFRKEYDRVQKEKKLHTSEYRKLRDRTKKMFDDLQDKILSNEDAKQSNKGEKHGEKEDAKPTEKRDWLETEYKKNRDNFRTDEKWAEHTASKFQKEFKTKEKPSPTSMKRYGIYKGLK